MAKPVGVTEDDLLKGAGGFDAFNRLGNGKPVRDNPFRDTRPQIEAPTQTPVSTTEGTAAIAQPQAKVTPSPVQPAPKKAMVDVVPRSRAVANISPAAEVREGEKRDLKKDKFPEKLTTFVTTQMRDNLLSESRKLNSRRLVKGDPLTSNTLIRCGIRVITELVEFGESDVVSSEEELYALIRRKLKV